LIEFLRHHASTEILPGHFLYPEKGILFQPVAPDYNYSQDYWQEYQSRRGTAIEYLLNEFRVKFVSPSVNLYDVGIGNGSFLLNHLLYNVASPGLTLGYDVNPYAVAWLKQIGCYCEPTQVPEEIDTWCFWDVLEHLADPSVILNLIPTGKYVCVSLPIFADLYSVKDSKHYKPNGEHRWYATSKGFCEYMAHLGFEVLAEDSEETAIGRDSITSFKFVKV
jgi:hypothetical protein